MTTRTLRMAAPLALSLPVSCGGGGEGAHSPLVLVEDAWVRPADAGMNSAIYLTLLNEGGEADRLLGGETPAAVQLQIHQSRLDDGIMRMRQVEAVDLPRGQEVEMKPGGLHIMLVELKESLAEGGSITLLLRFQRSGTQTLQVPVQSGGDR